ncbi:MAG: nitroreductase family protein [Proteobacteria bacterium]|nr:nitroreductase family protein [Pseudomonadota bacterium]
MDLFLIDKETCNKDGICATVCPTSVIDFKKGEYPVPVKMADEICIRCGHCVAVCPKGSFSHKDIPVADCSEINEAYSLSVDQAEHFLRSRRSIRVYKDKPVSRESLARLIDIARYAPSGHNSQCAEWLVVDSRKELEKLSAVTVDWMRWMLENASEFALSLHMDLAVRRYEKGMDVILRHAPAVIVTHAHKENQLAPATCTIALAYLELAAVSMGFGTCFAGYLKAAENFFPKMKETLALPNGHECLGAMMVGYPKFKYHRLPTRKEPLITWR